MPGVSERIANTIMTRFPTQLHLLKEYANPQLSEKEKEELLSALQVEYVTRYVDPVSLTPKEKSIYKSISKTISTRIYRLFTSEDGNEKLMSSGISQSDTQTT